MHKNNAQGWLKTFHWRGYSLGHDCPPWPAWLGIYGQLTMGGYFPWNFFFFFWSTAQFKTYKLLISGIFHLIFLHHGWLWVTETTESEMADKGGLLYWATTMCQRTLHMLLVGRGTEAQRGGLDKEPCPRLPRQNEVGFEPGLAETSTHRHGAASSGSQRGKGQLKPWGTGSSSWEARAPLGSPISKSREIRGSNKLC